MFENLTLADGVNSKIKQIMIGNQQLSFEFDDEVSGICFSKFDRIKLSLIRTDESKYFSYLESLIDALSSKYENLHSPISQNQYTKIIIDLDRSKVFAKGSKYLLSKLAMKELFESRRKVSGRIKFMLYHHEHIIYLIANVDILSIGSEI
jgi:hypothetical protein